MYMYMYDKNVNKNYLLNSTLWNTQSLLEMWEFSKTLNT